MITAASKLQPEERDQDQSQAKLVWGEEGDSGMKGFTG